MKDSNVDAQVVMLPVGGIQACTGFDGQPFHPWVPDEKSTFAWLNCEAVSVKDASLERSWPPVPEVEKLAHLHHLMQQQ